MTISISTHILDQESGQPAAELAVTLLDDAGCELSNARTDLDGRISEWPGFASGQTGGYTLQFDVAGWFAGRGQRCFYRIVQIEFEADTDRHYHVPLLLSPFGYSTDRGS